MVNNNKILLHKKCTLICTIRHTENWPIQQTFQQGQPAEADIGQYILLRKLYPNLSKKCGRSCIQKKWWYITKTLSKSVKEMWEELHSKEMVVYNENFIQICQRNVGGVAFKRNGGIYRHEAPPPPPPLFFFPKKKKKRRKLKNHDNMRLVTWSVKTLSKSIEICPVIEQWKKKYNMKPPPFFFP